MKTNGLYIAGSAALLLGIAAVVASERSPIAPRDYSAKQPAGAPGPAAALSDELRRKLEALEPGKPEAYFELGEDVALDATDPAQTALSRRLLVLAYHLDRARGGRRLAGAACLALAEISPGARDRRWLWSLASGLDRRHSRPDWVRRSQEQYSDQAGLRAAAVLGMFRSGDGRAALELLKEPGVRGLLQSYERALSPTGDTGALRSLEREAERWPCPECHNQRIIRKSGTGKDPQYRLCPNCNGNPGPRLSADDLIVQLRLESALLRGIQRSWAAQAATDLGAPLRDPDPEELAHAMGVDVTRTLFRNGEWVASGPAQTEPTVDSRPAPPSQGTEKPPGAPPGPG